MAKTTEVSTVESSGNVFADLGFENAEELNTKYRKKTGFWERMTPAPWLNNG